MNATSAAPPVPGAGPLAGIPFGVMDDIDRAPFPPTGGRPGLSEHRPGADAPAVARAPAAGGHEAFKLNLHEPAFGVTSNTADAGAVATPFDLARVAGGS